MTNELKEFILSIGASGIGFTDEKIPVDLSFRAACESNACGKYGKCWTCPPDAGDINTLSASLEKYNHALVYQLVCPLEDSFDFEGMMDAKKRFFSITKQVQEYLTKHADGEYLHLGAGGCGVCPKCAKEDDLPCRFPSLAITSLEAYGVAVSTLAKNAGLKYINGPNTVTYFGAIFF